jgi:hypothetical protein
LERFSRFENQYIMMLALRAKKELSEERDGQTGYIDPNIDSYIESLGSIAEKAKSNMREYDKSKSSL